MKQILLTDDLIKDRDLNTMHHDPRGSYITMILPTKDEGLKEHY
jgi:hypothetical protein